MAHQHSFENGGGPERHEDIASERFRRIGEARATRDARQADLLNVLSHSSASQESQKYAWDCWMELQMAQLDLDLLLKAELHRPSK